MPRPRNIEQQKLVLVEGEDEIRILDEIVKRLAITDVQVLDYGGHSKLRSFLKTLPALPRFESVHSLAIIADANSSRNNREGSIRDALVDMGFPCPSAPLQVSSDSELQVVYLVVPHDQESGMLEDVCLNSVSSDPAMQCVDHYFDCIDQANTRGPNQVWRSKARVHAFLASREDPRLRLGEAAQRGVWPLESDAFRSLRELLTLL